MANKACENVFRLWNWVSNATDCNKGCRLAVGWDNNVIDANLLASHDQVMHFEVRIINDKRKFFISFIYRENEPKDRLKLWEYISDHMKVVDNHPWAIMGDFNVIMYADEHSKGSIDNYHGVKEFRGCMEHLDMEDLAMNGFFFTWVPKMKDPENGIMKKLDKIMAIPDVAVKRKNSFRFMNFLADKKEFHQLVRENWNKPINGYAMFVLVKRLKGMKKHLRSLNKKNGNVYKKVKSLRDELKKVQTELDKDPHNVKLKEDEIVFNNAYREALLDEEKVLKQKTKDDEVAGQFVSHFQSFLGTCDEVFPIEEPDELFINKMDPEIALTMIRDVSDDEIRVALHDIDDNKAPGPDGFTSRFFKASWETIGKDFCLAVKEFFPSAKMLGELNATLISLIPKCKIPLKVTDYRPIACCNVVYKCISKVITNRIKVVLKDLIDENQSAFIEGRQISDNIMVAQELMCGYSKNKKIARCTFKVDIQKAHDTVSWDFLKFCLFKFGFHNKMVNWIMVCLSSASFSISVNGESHEFFKARRGLRQGDPMSPCLFTVVIEVFTLMLKRQVSKEKKFKYHWGCKKLSILNLCFADDLMLFCHGDVISASVMRRALDEFCLVSGLRPNMAKSTVFFGNVKDIVKRDIKSVMPFNKGILSVKYLGIPLDSNKISKSDYKGTCEDVDKLLKNFLWRNDDKKSCKYSVAWKEVKWVKNQWLKEDSIWVVQAKSDYSWSWKQILSLRDKISNFVQVKIGNGRNCYFWFDKWYEKWPICKLVNLELLMQHRMDLKVKVAELICNGMWRWPRGWSDRVLNKTLQKLFGVTTSGSHNACLDILLFCGWLSKEDSKLRTEFQGGLISKTCVVLYASNERNIRLFGNAGRSEEELFKIIFESVRSRLMGLNLKITPDVIEATRIWNVPIDRMYSNTVRFSLCNNDTTIISRMLVYVNIGKGVYQHAWLCLIVNRRWSSARDIWFDRFGDFGLYLLEEDLSTRLLFLGSFNEVEVLAIRDLWFLMFRLVFYAEFSIWISVGYVITVPLVNPGDHHFWITYEGNKEIWVRKIGWVIVYLEFILSQDCTRSSDRFNGQ
ncbi:RNA-directed DNA polymerase, eukaryota, reverse transcriptase zinc-binding domain protein [Tanacetum coccineum]